MIELEPEWITKAAEWCDNDETIAAEIIGTVQPHIEHALRQQIAAELRAQAERLYKIDLANVFVELPISAPDAMN